MNYIAEFKDVSIHTYLDLRKRSGLSPKTEEAAKIGLKNSICAVLVSEAGPKPTPIGMGRIVGDGGCHCQIVDVCVLPDYQGKGIGTLIMGRLTEFIDNNLPESCYISLIADGTADNLYERYGFKDTLPDSKGMFYRK